MGFLLWQPQLLSELGIGFLHGNNWRPRENINRKPGKRQREQGPGVQGMWVGRGARQTQTRTN